MRTSARCNHAEATASTTQDHQSSDEVLAHLNPDPSSYNISPFADRANITLFAGAGGHGCVSFLREKFVPDGPPNGGDGGDGGSIWIQAVRNETSLLKLSRRSELRAGRGGNGRGSAKGGERGKDVLVTVPVGTIVREVQRYDPRVEEAERLQELTNKDDDGEGLAEYGDTKWIKYPGMTPYEQRSSATPRLPRPRTSSTAALQMRAPIHLDLDEDMERPMLLVAGAAGGWGNPHFVSKQTPRPKYATRGEAAMTLQLQLELKMLADVGLVGLPNAGKSTLLRALTNSRTRVGNWAFTTLQPTIGTVVLDDNRGRPILEAFDESGKQRTSFTIADIPGLVEDAHLDKGLGLGFLRHVERAGVLAFVIDLAAGDAVRALQALWREVSEYETLRARELSADTEFRMGTDSLEEPGRNLPSEQPPISSKPWFVVATKADLPETQTNFQALLAYIDKLKTGEEAHPSGRPNAWRKNLVAMPVSAIRAEGVKQISKHIIDLTV